jgi:hypothetical protein
VTGCQFHLRYKTIAMLIQITGHQIDGLWIIRVQLYVFKLPIITHPAITWLNFLYICVLLGLCMYANNVNLRTINTLLTVKKSGRNHVFMAFHLLKPFKQPGYSVCWKTCSFYSSLIHVIFPSVVPLLGKNPARSQKF